MFEIYVISNTVNGKKYVGQTCKGVDTRWDGHIKASRYGCDFYFSHAIRKHGSRSFTHQVVAEVETGEWANYVERVWIMMLGTTDRKVGYNSLLGGGNGRLHTDDTKDKISKALKGKTISDDALLKRYGRPCSSETRQRLRTSLTANMVGPKNHRFGKSVSLETKEKIREGVINNHRKRGNKVIADRLTVGQQTLTL